MTLFSCTENFMEVWKCVYYMETGGTKGRRILEIKENELNYELLR